MTGGTISNGDALGGLIGFGTNPIALYSPSITINIAGITQLPSFTNNPGPLTGPATMSVGVLPIELIDFITRVSNNRVEFDWSTASELNNDFFTIERAYNTVDESPLPGISYYRLKQTDFDGKFTYSELRKVEVTEIKTNFRIYPNPIINNTFNLELIGMPNAGEVPVRIVNMQGASVFEANYLADQYGRIKVSIELNPLSSGMYMVVVNAVTGLRTKIVIP